MLLPALVLLAGSCVGAAGVGRIASSVVAVPMPPGAAVGPASTQLGAPVTVLAWPSVGLALLLAVHQLSRQHPPGLLNRSAQRVLDPLSAGLDFLHSGAIGDYVAWVVAGLAPFAAAFGLG